MKWFLFFVTLMFSFPTYADLVELPDASLSDSIGQMDAPQTLPEQKDLENLSNVFLNRVLFLNNVSMEGVTYRESIRIASDGIEIPLPNIRRVTASLPYGMGQLEILEIQMQGGTLTLTHH